MGMLAPNHQAFGHMGPRYDLGLANKTQPYQLPRSLLWSHAIIHTTTGYTFKKPRVCNNGGYGRM